MAHSLSPHELCCCLFCNAAFVNEFTAGMAGSLLLPPARHWRDSCVQAGDGAIDCTTRIGANESSGSGPGIRNGAVAHRRDQRPRLRRLE